MVDQDLVTSGCDIEVLLSGRYVRYALMAQIEAGTFPLSISVADTDLLEGEPYDVTITIHPPSDYERRYEPHPDVVFPPARDGSLDCVLLDDDPSGANVHVTAIVDLHDNLHGLSRADESMGLLASIVVVSDADDRGFERNHRLALSVVDFDALTRLGLAFAGLDADTILDEVRKKVDREMPFGVASGQAVQNVRTRLLAGDAEHQPAIGAYVNLALHNGPEPDAFVDDRGDPADGTNFLVPGADLAFATAKSLYGLLGADVKFRMAEPAEGGGFHYPLRADPNDPESKELGRVKGVSVGPELLPGGLETGLLLIDIHGEYTDAPGDPDFHLQLHFTPHIDDGELRWEVEPDVDLGLFATIVVAVAAIGIGIFLGPGAAIGVLAVLVAAGAIVEAVATAAVRDKIDSSDATFLNALPNRVPVMRRRWDPLYATDHQVVALMDAFAVTKKGLAFDGVAALDRQPAAIASVVVRDEVRHVGTVSGLRYRVNDAPRFAEDFTEIAAGTDRRSYVFADPVAEPTLVDLTLDEIADRIGDDPTQRRLREQIPYVPRKINLFEHKIDNLLVVARREIDEQRDAVIAQFRRDTAAAIRADQGDTIRDEEHDRLVAELGREPTAAELTDAVNARVTALVDEAQPAFVEDELPALLETAVDRISRFDLRPDEFADLQRRQILFIEGKEIIRMRRDDGGITVYFRDHPDGVRSDNLLELPHYRRPYEPPA